MSPEAKNTMRELIEAWSRSRQFAEYKYWVKAGASLQDMCLSGALKSWDHNDTIQIMLDKAHREYTK